MMICILTRARTRLESNSGSDVGEEADLISEGNSTGCRIRNPDVTIGASFGCGLSLKGVISGMPPLTAM